MKKRFYKIVGYLIYCIPYLGMWMFAATFFAVAVNEGWHVDFGLVYGKPFSYIYRLFAVLIFVSPLLLPIVKRKRFYIVYFILPYLLSIMLFASVIALDNYADDKLTFSTEDWIEYPQLRPTLYENLKEKLDLNGYTKDEVELLLGQPSETGENVYMYGDGNGNNVFVEFSDELVSDCYFQG